MTNTPPKPMHPYAILALSRLMPVGTPVSIR